MTGARALATEEEAAERGGALSEGVDVEVEVECEDQPEAYGDKGGLLRLGTRPMASGTHAALDPLVLGRIMETGLVLKAARLGPLARKYVEHH